MAAERDNFFSRWSQRKAQVRAGQPSAPDLLPHELPPHEPQVPGLPPRSQEGPEPLAAPVEPPGAAATAPTDAPVPTLEDVAGLGRESDFRPFVARHVPAEVRNAAVKKLFADPHFNVMDGLDIYIDDYARPNPLSAARMAKMVGAQFLKLVDDPDQARHAIPGAVGPATAGTSPDEVATPTPGADEVPGEGEPAPSSLTAGTGSTQDDHTDLQLQPDHAPERPGPGRGTG